ncbi:putative Tigger transposable element-derived protein 1-like 299 [Homarus americanus]|uniref:Putative Tigger transposable element-derived protein 1-like 299 n=1 Tax=Homarus americanus TaxID=6706 RepID=A0A8J5KFH5_HOMAM|nr:putative Tigger transposable element-derived protein 1-like 299 [Homarus americanus]
MDRSTIVIFVHYTLQGKVKLLNQLREGMSFAAVGRLYNVNESTVRTIKKRKKRYLKAKSLHTRFTPAAENHYPSTSAATPHLGAPPTPFQASKGWFDNFKRRFGLKNVKMTGRLVQRTPWLQSFPSWGVESNTREQGYNQNKFGEMGRNSLRRSGSWPKYNRFLAYLGEAFSPTITGSQPFYNKFSTCDSFLAQL